MNINIMEQNWNEMAIMNGIFSWSGFWDGAAGDIMPGAGAGPLGALEDGAIATPIGGVAGGIADD